MSRLLRSCLLVFTFFATLGAAQVQAQTSCRITLDELASPVACLGGQYTMCYTTSGGPSCFSPSGTYTLKLYKSLPIPPFYNSDTTLAEATVGGGNRCVTINVPTVLDTNRFYALVVIYKEGTRTTASNVKFISVRPVDRSPKPISHISVSPIKSVYCPKDTVVFTVDQLIVANNNPPATYQWLKNGTPIENETRPVLRYTGLVPGDCFTMLVTKGNQCAANDTGTSNTICLRVKLPPRLVINQQGSGCADSLTTYRLDTANIGVGGTIQWFRNDVFIPGTTNLLAYVLQPGVAACRDKIYARAIIRDCPDTVKSNTITVQNCGRVRVDNVTPTGFCAGDSLIVDYSTVACFDPANVFTFQLSDASGSFANPTDIGSVIDSNGGRATVQVPASLLGGTNYFLRILSSSPNGISLNNFGPLTIFARPANVTQLPAVRCGPGPIKITVQAAGAVRYNWYTAQIGGQVVTRPGGAAVTTDTFTVFVSRDTTFYVEAVNANGCKSSERQPVRVTVGLPITVSAGPDQQACEGGQCIQLIGGSPTGGTYSAASPADTAINGSAFCPGTLPAGFYTIKYLYISPIGCRDSATKQVEIKANPAPDAGTPDSTVCKPGPPVSFQLKGFSPAGGVWSGPGVDADGNVTVASLGAVNTLTYTVTSANGCSRSDTRIIRTTTGPQVTVTTTPPLACGTPTGTVTLSPFDASWTIAWFNANGTPVSPAPAGPGPVFTGIAAGSYTVRLTGSNGCTSEFGFVISDLTPPVVNITGLNANYCSADACVTLTGTPAGGQWSTNPSTNAIGANTGVFCPNLAAVGTVQVFYTVTDAFGCVGSDTASTIISQSPIAAAERDTTVCANSPAFTLSTGGSWTGGAGLSGPNGSGVYSFNPATAGAVNILIKTLIANGCTTTVQRTIFVRPVASPILSPTGTQRICQGGTLTLNVTLSSGATLPAPGISFIVRRNGSNYLSGTAGPFILRDPGRYTVLGLDSAGCSDTSATSVTVIIDSLGTISAGPDTSVCRNASAFTLRGTPANGSGITGEFRGPGVVGGTTFDPSLIAAGTTSVNIFYVVQQGVCKDSARRTITMLNALTATLQGPNGQTQSCVDPIALTAGPTGPGFRYFFFRNDTLLTPGGTSSPIFSATRSGSYTVYVQSGDAAVCGDTSDAVNIIISRPPTLPTLTSVSRCVGDPSLQLEAPAAGTFTSYVWKPDSVITGGPDPYFFTGTRPGNYTLTIVVRNGACVDSATKGVSIFPIPNFTVNRVNATSCSSNDGVASVRGVDTSSYSIVWSPGIPSRDTIVRNLAPGSYTVSVTNRLTGCSNSLGFTIIAPGTFRAHILNAPSVICRVDTNIVLTADSTGGQFFWNTVPPSGSDRPISGGILNPINFSPGTYMLIYRVTNASGCTGIDTVNFTIKKLPNAPVTPAGPLTICQGSPTTLTTNCATGNTYTWLNNSAPVTPAQTTCTLTTNLAGFYSVKVDSAGCSNTSVGVTVNVIPGPVATIQVVGNDSACVGSTVTLVANGAGSTDVIDWRLVGSTSSLGNTAQLGVNVSGNYQLVISNGSCSDTALQTVTFFANPFDNVSGNFSPCQGDSTTLTSNATGVTYLWKNSSGTIRSTTNTVSIGTAGQYTLRVTTIASPNCFKDTTFFLTPRSRPNPGVDTSGPLRFCQGGSVTLTSLEPASPNLTYDWGGGRNTRAITVNTSGNYSVTVSNAGCSVTSNVFAVIVDPVPTLTTTPAGSLTVCQGQPLTITGHGRPAGGLTYIFTIGTTQVYSGPDSVLTVNTSTFGTQVISVQVTNGRCTTSAAPVTVRIKQKPQASISALGNTNICPGQTVTLIGNTFGGATPNFLRNTDSIGVGTPVATVLPVGQAGLYQFVLTLDGCSDTTKPGITVNIPTITPPNAGLNRQFCVTAPPAAITGYSPALGDSVRFVEGYITGDLFDPAAAGIGIKTVTLEVRNGGCRATDTATYVVVPGFTTSVDPSDVTVCAGTPVNLIATLQPRVSGATYSYQWYNGDGSIITGATDSSFTANAAGPYYVVASLAQCDSRSNQAQVRYFPFVPVVVGSDTTVCINTPAFTLGASPAGGRWTGRGVEVGGRFTPSDAGVGKHTLIYSTQQGGCELIDSIHITVNPLPVVAATYTNLVTQQVGEPIDILESAQLNATGAQTYVWGPDVNLSSTTGASVTASPQTTQTYQVVGTTDGCSASATVTVTVRTDVRVANGMSPNGDGENDVWYIYNIQAYPDADIKVYNRWGALVYKAKGRDLKTAGNYWDGTSEGKDVPVGAYYYTIDLNNNQKPFIGSVTLVR